MQQTNFFKENHIIAGLTAWHNHGGILNRKSVCWRQTHVTTFRGMRRNSLLLPPGAENPILHYWVLRPSRHRKGHFRDVIKASAAEIAACTTQDSCRRQETVITDCPRRGWCRQHQACHPALHTCHRTESQYNREHLWHTLDGLDALAFNHS